MKTTMAALLLALAGLFAAALAQTESSQAMPGAGPSRREEPPLVPDRDAGASYAPTTRVLFTDPVREPHGISDALVRDIEGVPSGGSIDVSTYWLSSARLGTALGEAFRRGVQVRAIFSGIPAAHQPAGVGLAALLGEDSGDASWVEWSRGSARGAAGGIMHQKTWLFSQVGSVPWVVVTGSYNASSRADEHTYALMWQVVRRREVYDAFARISAQQATGAPVAHPYREFSGPGWDAYFLPIDDDTPARDPVLARLRRIPAGPRTSIRIAMFSMWGDRARWLADQLAEMSRRGAQVELFAGPTVDRRTRVVLRAAGAQVRAGCFADGSYTHSKDMSATWIAGGVRHYRTWIGSDNWTSDSLVSDQAVLGIAGPAYFAQFHHATAALLSRGDAVPTAWCRPDDGVG